VLSVAGLAVDRLFDATLPSLSCVPRLAVVLVPLLCPTLLWAVPVI
jgi:hypothetical protein